MNFSSTMNVTQAQGAGSCLSLQTQEENQTSLDTECPTVWDGFICWSSTMAGRTVYRHCPVAKGSDVTKQAYRVCGASGQWLDRNGEPDSNKGWTNYGPCLTQEILDLIKRLYSGSDEEAQSKFRIAQHTRILELVGFSLSLAALLLSLFIFHHFRSLRNPRTRLHRHLFVAMVIQVAIRLTLYIDQAVTRSNVGEVEKSLSDPNYARGIDNTPILCEAAYICLEYARTAMFMWMFVEGLYLHNMITVTVFEEKLSPFIYPLVGWVVPIPLTAVWAIITAMQYGMTTCWWGYNFTVYFWILEGPRLGVLMVNLAFLLNILRVLVTKLRQSNSSEAHQARKAVKAALVLLPLLGLTNLLNMLDAPLERSSVEFGLWSFTTHLLTSSQGLIVSFLYCFWNGEVQIAIKKFIRQKILGATKFGPPRATVRMTLLNHSQNNRSVNTVVNTENMNNGNQRVPRITNGITITVAEPGVNHRVANNNHNIVVPESQVPSRQINFIPFHSNNLTVIQEELPVVEMNNHYVKNNSKLRLFLPPIFKYRNRQREGIDVSPEVSDVRMDSKDGDDVEDVSIAFEISPLECHSQVEIEAFDDSLYRTASV